MLNEIAKEIAETVKESVQAGIKEVSAKYEARIAELEKQLADQADALKGIIVPKEDDIKEIAKSLIPDTQAITEEISKSVSVPEDGKSVTLDDVKPLIEEAVAEIKAAIPAPQKGEKGEDGKDALEIEILPEIDEEKSYARGTYATHKGGLWRSYERTKGMRGWECIVAGQADIAIEYDGERKCVINIEKSNGESVVKEIHIPAILSKGMWREGKYEKGDTVVLSGSTWMCMEDTEDRPSIESKAWIMAAKKGGTGKSAYDVAKEAGFEGTKLEWLEKTMPKVKV